MIVSTPQDVALVDARKGVGMFNKVSIPVCPHPQTKIGMLRQADIADRRITTQHVTLYLLLLLCPSRTVWLAQEFPQGSYGPKFARTRYALLYQVYDGEY